MWSFTASTARWLTRWITHSSPNAVWVTDEAGEVIWSNTAYRNLVKALGLKEEGPGPSILRGHDPVRSLPDREQRRHQLTYDDGRPPCWIDVSETVENGLRLHHAVDVTAVVQAEAAQRTFVQTLTKTFAQLSTGLAIFDRTRRLALFNPALVDMTGLSAEYLSGRPGYLSFFDRLRDSDSMPEPRSYANWREKIFDLIAAAEDGRYQETWTLSSGRTYRVTGRPHPNGAIAFLLEDISAEVTLTRRFREQLDMSNAVIEALDRGGGGVLSAGEAELYERRLSPALGGAQRGGPRSTSRSGRLRIIGRTAARPAPSGAISAISSSASRSGRTGRRRCSFATGVRWTAGSAR